MAALEILLHNGLTLGVVMVERKWNPVQGEAPDDLTAAGRAESAYASLPTRIKLWRAEYVGRATLSLALRSRTLAADLGV